MSSENNDLSGGEAGPSSEGDTPVLTGPEVRTDTPLTVSNRNVEAEIALGSAIVQTVWAWIEGLRMRLKIKKDLGRKATQADLTSIDTWMKVDEMEQRQQPAKSRQP